MISNWPKVTRRAPSAHRVGARYRTMLFVWLRRRSRCGCRRVDSLTCPRDGIDSEQNLSSKSFSLVSERARMENLDWCCTRILWSENESPCSGKHFQSFEEQRIFDLYYDSPGRSESEYRCSFVCPTRQRPAVLFYFERRRRFRRNKKTG